MELEKSDIPGGFSDTNDCKSHLREIEHLRVDMGKILGSDAFDSLEGKSKIQELLNEGSQVSVHNALNQLIDGKIAQYSNSDQSKQDSAILQIGNSI